MRNYTRQSKKVAYRYVSRSLDYLRWLTGKVDSNGNLHR